LIYPHLGCSAAVDHDAAMPQHISKLGAALAVVEFLALTGTSILTPAI
jgi:hypothetical protein